MSVVQKGDWSNQDNKKYIGKIDRIYVSMSETYEVEYYIDHYLKKRGYAVNKDNRAVIERQLNQYPGRAPFQRDQLDVYLDQHISKKA